MNCPACNWDNYYYGLNGHDCVNPGCTHFNNGKIVGSNGEEKEPSIAKSLNDYWWIGEDSKFEDFAFVKPTLFASTSNAPVLVYKKNPYICVLTHDNVGYYAGIIKGLQLSLSQKNTVHLHGCSGGNSPKTAVVNYQKTITTNIKSSTFSNDVLRLMGKK